MRNKPEYLFDEFDTWSEPPAEWFLPELCSATRKRPADEELGLHRFLEFPEAVAPRVGVTRPLPAEQRNHSRRPERLGAA